MTWIFLMALFFLPFISHAGFWDDARQSEFFKNVKEKYIPSIPTGFSEGEEIKSASAEAFKSQWENVKRNAKEKAGIDLTKFFSWLAGALASIFSWLAAFFTRLAPH